MDDQETVDPGRGLRPLSPVFAVVRTRPDGRLACVRRGHLSSARRVALVVREAVLVAGPIVEWVARSLKRSAGDANGSGTSPASTVAGMSAPTFRTIIEPFRIHSVEPLRMTTRAATPGGRDRGPATTCSRCTRRTC